jgi:hypothetical protein
VVGALASLASAQLLFNCQQVVCLELSHGGACCIAPHSKQDDSSATGRETTSAAGSGEIGHRDHEQMSSHQSTCSSGTAHVVYEELDVRAEVAIRKTWDGRYILVESKREVT